MKKRLSEDLAQVPSDKQDACDIEYDGSHSDGRSHTLSEEELKAIEGNRLTRFLFAPVKRAIISASLSVFFSVAWALAPGSISTIFAGGGGAADYAGVAIAVGVAVIYLIFLIATARHDRRFEQARLSYRDVYNRLVRSNNALVRVLSGQKAILTQVSQKANEAIHKIEAGGVVDPTFWAFEDSCQSACDSVRRVLLDYCCGVEEDDIEVGYVKLDEEATTRTIRLCAFSGGAGSTPRIHCSPRRVETDPYFDSRLFRDARDGVIVLLTNKEIQDSFYWPAGVGSRSRSKYTQFSAVPVFCNRGHGGGPKMIGLFEVSCLGGSLGEDRREVENVMKSLVSPYGSIMLVIHKLHKGVHVQPPSTRPPLGFGRRRRR